MTNEIEKQEELITVNYNNLMNVIASVLLRNADNKLTVENLNGIMSSITQDIEKLKE